MTATTENRLEILGIIPARGGSKGIPGKNLRELAGRPLLAYTTEAAKASRRLTRIILTTDSPEIAESGRQLGVEVPFLRPAELAQDASPTVSVIEHAVEWLSREEAYRPDIIVLLQPTAPLRRTEHLDEAIDCLVSSQVDSVVSVMPVPGHCNPHWQFVIDGGELRLFTGESLPQIVRRRQDLPRTYTRDGALYVFWRTTLERTSSMYGDRCAAYVMPEADAINIDGLDEWAVAERRLLARSGCRSATREPPRCPSTRANSVRS